MTDEVKTTELSLQKPIDRVIRSTLLLLVFYIDSAACVDMALVRDTLDSIVSVRE